MKRMRGFRISQILPWCAGIPLILATWGYFLAYTSTEEASHLLDRVIVFSRALYRAVAIYGISVDESAMSKLGPGYWQLEAARWLALLVTTSVFVNLLRMATSRMVTQLRVLHRDAVTLHGDPGLLDRMRRELGARAITGTMPERFRACTHILAFESERAMYDYLVANHGAFFGDLGKRIYLCTLRAAYPTNRDAGIFVSNIAENCARLYWEERYLRKGEQRIAIVGFEEYGERILAQALMVNVFRASREIRYVVYSDGASFLSLHPGIAQFISIGEEKPGWDALLFCAEPWEKCLDELARADRVIACHNSDEENLRLLDRLIERGATAQIDVRAINEELPRRLWSGDEAGIGVFGTEDRLYTLDVVMRETLLNRAKLIHARYVRHVDGVVETCERRRCDKRAAQCLNCDAYRKSWEALGPFKRGSNIAQADHMSVKVREVLEEDGVPDENTIRRFKRKYEEMTHSEKASLLAMEHDRWSRYLIFHGWTYAPVRDDAHKKHNLLVPYIRLSEDQWAKNGDAFEMVPEIFTLEKDAAFRKRHRA